MWVFIYLGYKKFYCCRHKFKNKNVLWNFIRTENILYIRIQKNYGCFFYVTFQPISIWWSEKLFKNTSSSAANFRTIVRKLDSSNASMSPYSVRISTSIRFTFKPLIWTPKFLGKKPITFALIRHPWAISGNTLL